MARQQKNAIRTVESVADFLGLDVHFNGNKYPMNATSAEVEGYTITGVLDWSNEDFNDLIDHLKTLSKIENKKAKKEYLRWVYPTENTLAKIDNEYVKDSYKESKLLLRDLITGVFNNSKHAACMLESIDNKYISYNFSTHSAFLYEGFYITPCNVRTALKEVLEAIKPAYMQQYMQHFYQSKVKQDLIIDDIIMAWKNDDNYRLTVLDRMRHASLINN